MRRQSRGTWVETPSGGFLWDPAAAERDYERPRVYAELPPPREPETETETEDDYYRPRRGVVVL